MIKISLEKWVDVHSIDIGTVIYYLYRHDLQFGTNKEMRCQIREMTEDIIMDCLEEGLKVLLARAEEVRDQEGKQ